MLAHPLRRRQRSGRANPTGYVAFGSARQMRSLTLAHGPRASRSLRSLASGLGPIPCSRLDPDLAAGESALWVVYVCLLLALAEARGPRPEARGPDQACSAVSRTSA